MDISKTSFEFTVDFSDIQEKKPRLSLTEGYYQVLIKEAYINPERNKNRAIFNLEFTGDFAGNWKNTGLNLPGTTKGDIRGLWLELMYSAGYTADQIKTGAVKVNGSVVQGKNAYIYYKPGTGEVGSDDQYDTIKFRNPDTWNKMKAQFEGTAQNFGGATATATTPPAPAAGFANPTVSSADLLNMVKN